MEDVSEKEDCEEYNPQHAPVSSSEDENKDKDLKQEQEEEEEKEEIPQVHRDTFLTLAFARTGSQSSS